MKKNIYKCPGLKLGWSQAADNPVFKFLIANKFFKLIH